MEKSLSQWDLISWFLHRKGLSYLLSYLLAQSARNKLFPFPSLISQMGFLSSR